MKEISFTVKSWAAFAPNLQSKKDWQEWAFNKKNISTDLSAVPEVDFLPKIYSRRLSQLTKMSLKVAFECAKNEQNLQSIFASRFGEWNQTLKLLQSISAGEDVSPAGFSLSVHNTAAGIYSITNKNTAPYTAIAANELTFESALIEVLGRLENQKSILLVVAEESVPELYRQTFTDPVIPFAMAFLLSCENLPTDPNKIILKPNSKSNCTIDSFDFLRWFLNSKQELPTRFFLMEKL